MMMIVIKMIIIILSDFGVCNGCEHYDMATAMKIMICIAY